jgi:oxepin-CoA hydrolase/3-oxo-5,6-dehydrosuberyl-CoA semialdehyde dehydrogenase
MMTLSSYLAGRWAPMGGRVATLVNPANEAPVAEVATEGFEGALALAYARERGIPALAAMTFAQRASMLRDLSKYLHARREELLDLAQANGGNTRGDAKFDVDGAIGTLAAYAVTGDALAARCGDRTWLLDGDAAALTRSPRFAGQHAWFTRPGVAVHINAFNFPAWGTFEKAAVAWLAGTPIITKPATATAVVAFRMGQLVVESGLLPAGAFQLLVGSVGDLLTLLGPQDSLAFTGSNATGAMLRGTRGFAERGVRVNVEADSLNAAVLGPDVVEGDDLFVTAVRHVATDMTQKTGQKCTAIRRVLVPGGLLESFEAALVEQLDTHVVGDPTTEGVTVGPVATAQQLADVTGGIATLARTCEVRRGGASRVDGRGAPAGKGYFVAPTVLRAVAADAGAVHDLEVFGPCVTLVPYDGSAGAAASLVGRGQGSLVSTAYSDDRAWIAPFTGQAAPWLGRLMLVSAKVSDQVTAPGMVLPSCVHGGPGRAGGGEELGGERGLSFYMQRTAIQGDRGLMAKFLGGAEPA